MLKDIRTLSAIGEKLENTSHDQSTDTPLSIPLAAYASLQVKDDALHVVGTAGDTAVVYEDVARQQNTTAEDDALTWLHQVALQHHLQFIALAFQQEDRLQDMVSRLWLQEDIVPYRAGQQGTVQAHSLEDQVKELTTYFDRDNIVTVGFDAAREVQVSELVSLEDYRKVAPQEDFALLTDLARSFQGKRLVFISATQQGGGVALMRHALIRLLRLLNVDAHWHVLLPKKEAFDITKPKFHNVLQAVASPDTVLTSEDKAIYDVWMEENAREFADVFQQADVIVIDDPQPAGLIPHIKQAKPDCKIIYRSHIQIVAELASQPGTPQHTTWSFLWDRIKDADYFISHPMKMFIPDGVPAEKIFYMPATTDPLDGLNKPLSEEQMANYMTLFNALLLQSGQKLLDAERPYIIQIARFDPSKGIPDLIESYYKLRCMLEEQNKVVPQLVITGNSSIDDPDGVPIYNRIQEMLASEPYVHFADDIKVVRLPHRDQILNTLLRKSAIVLQLSIREGFEIKVTEALMKGKPMIAYRVGGIPLQVEEGVTGYLVEAGNSTQVATYLYHLLTDEDLYQRMCKAAAERANTDYLTIPNAICWLFLALQLLSGEKMEGHYQWVKALAHQYQTV